MKISIITVVYNNKNTIRAAMNSVLSQDYDDLEYIIVDGASTDGTIEAIRDVIKKYPERSIKFVSEKDDGVYDAMNKGIKLSSGDVIAILNSDDVYTDQTIVSQMVEFMQSNGLDAAYGDLVYVKNNNTDHVTRFWKPGECKKGAFRYGWVLPHPTFFCRKEIFEKYGSFNKKFKIAADFELMLRFIEKHRIKVGYLPKVIVKMRAGGKANVLRGIIRGNWEIIGSFRRNNLRLSPWFFVHKPVMKISQLFRRPK